MDEESERVDLTARVLADIGAGFVITSVDLMAAERLGVDIAALQLIAEDLYGV